MLYSPWDSGIWRMVVNRFDATIMNRAQQWRHLRHTSRAQDRIDARSMLMRMRRK